MSLLNNDATNISVNTGIQEQENNKINCSTFQNRAPVLGKKLILFLQID